MAPIQPVPQKQIHKTLYRPLHRLVACEAALALADLFNLLDPLWREHPAWHSDTRPFHRHPGIIKSDELDRVFCSGVARTESQSQYPFISWSWS